MSRSADEWTQARRAIIKARTKFFDAIGDAEDIIHDPRWAQNDEVADAAINLEVHARTMHFTFDRLIGHLTPGFDAED